MWGYTVKKKLKWAVPHYQAQVTQVNVPSKITPHPKVRMSGLLRWPDVTLPLRNGWDMGHVNSVHIIKMGSWCWVLRIQIWTTHSMLGRIRNAGTYCWSKGETNPIVQYRTMIRDGVEVLGDSMNNKRKPSRGCQPSQRTMPSEAMTLIIPSWWNGPITGLE